LKDLPIRRIVAAMTRASVDHDVDVATDVWRMITGLVMERKANFPAIAASLGLNPGALHALLHLDENEPRSMSSLAGDWRCDASNVTWLVDRLEEKGFAERRPHPTDRRVRTVGLTEAGARARADAEARLFEAPESILALSAADLETVRAILAKVAPVGRPSF
jgi:DNA-binding MarR family transcriptional regulator